MKKFVGFIGVLIGIIVFVCLGLTTYYFMRNDETIAVNTKEIYVNVGDIITLDELDIVIKKPHKKTTFDYNAGGDKVTSLVKFEQEKGHYEVKAGGETQIVIKTSNSRCPEFKVSVHIGDGSAENPYFVEDQADLAQIGSAYALNGNYVMVKDVAVSELQPIGYDYAAQEWVGFSGAFNGNGHVISGLKQTNGEYTNAGLFYSLNGATVENLIITNATITGSYTRVGVLTALASGNIRSVAALNSSITTTSNTYGSVGGLIGELNEGNLSVSYSSNVSITVNHEDVVDNGAVWVGGLVGMFDKGTIQATYASNNIVINGTRCNVGGLVGAFTIYNDNGAILESYSTTTSEYANFAYFIADIVYAEDFDTTTANVLRYLAGNMAVGTPVVNTYDNTFFERFYDDASYSIYFIRDFENEDEMKAVNEHVYFALHSGSKTVWDSVWNIQENALPTLNLGSTSLRDLTADYLKRDAHQQNIDNATQLIAFLNKGTIDDEVYGLTGDIDLAGAEISAVNLNNSVFNGNGYTISNATIKNGSVRDDDARKYCGLFSEVRKSSIRDVNLENVVVDVASADDKEVVVGSVAGCLVDSNISNVQVSVANVNTDNVQLDFFGGLVGVVLDSTLENGTVKVLNLNNSKIAYVGGAVAINNGLVRNCKVAGVEVTDGEQTSTTVATLSAMRGIGGVAAFNHENVENSTANVEITNSNYNNGIDSLRIGGVAINNEGSIKDVQVNAKINVVKVENAAHYSIGGVAVYNSNSGSIENVTVTGDGVVVANDIDNANIGGVVANNSGSIKNVYNYLNSLGLAGEDYANKTIRVGGVADVNAGSIEQVVTSSNLNGTHVAGVVVEQDNAPARVNQVLVGKFNPETKEITDNEIKGSVYVAGVACYLMQGSVENIQASSSIVGTHNKAVVSLVVLEFPTTASLKNSTINSSLSGSAEFFNRDAYLEFTKKGLDDHYNIYSVVAAAGQMESVVVNMEKAKSNGITDIKQGTEKVNRFFGIVVSSSYQSSSFVKDVNNAEFANAASFKGSFSYKLVRTYTKELTFDFDTVWSDTNGANLQFLNK